MIIGKHDIKHLSEMQFTIITEWEAKWLDLWIIAVVSSFIICRDYDRSIWGIVEYAIIDSLIIIIVIIITMLPSIKTAWKIWMWHNSPCLHVTRISMILMIIMCRICIIYWMERTIIIYLIATAVEYITNRSGIIFIYSTYIEITVVLIVVVCIVSELRTWEYRAYHCLTYSLHLTCVIGIAWPWHSTRSTCWSHRAYDTCYIDLVFLSIITSGRIVELCILNSDITIRWQQTDYRWRIHITIRREWILSTTYYTTDRKSMICDIISISWRGWISNATSCNLDILNSGICTYETSQHTYIAVIAFAWSSIIIIERAVGSLMGKLGILDDKILNDSLLRGAYALNSSKESPYTIHLCINITGKPCNLQVTNFLSSSIKMSTETVICLIIVLHRTDRSKILCTFPSWECHIIIKLIVCLIVLRRSLTIIQICTYLIAEIRKQLKLFRATDKIRVGRRTLSFEPTRRDRYTNGRFCTTRLFCYLNNESSIIIGNNRLNIIGSARWHLFTIKKPTVCVSINIRTHHFHFMSFKAIFQPIIITHLQTCNWQVITTALTINPIKQVFIKLCLFIGWFKECIGIFCQFLLRTNILRCGIHIEDCRLYCIGKSTEVLAKYRTHIW